MKTISTGEPSTLTTYRNIAMVIDGLEEGAATRFIDAKIKESPNGENEIVIADESQMLYLLTNIAREKNKCPRCENEEVFDNHSFCKICGLKLDR